MTLRAMYPSKRAAQFVTAKMLTTMTSLIVVHRPSRPVFNGVTGMSTAGTMLTIWTGPCRINPVSGPQVSMTGDLETTFQSTTLVVPQDGTQVIHRDDLATVLVCREDSVLVSKVFRVLDVSMGGILNPTRTLQATTVEGNPFWNEP